MNREKFWEFMDGKLKWENNMRIQFLDAYN